MIKEAPTCRIFKAHNPSLAQGPWVTHDLAWITPEGPHEIILVMSDGHAYLLNRQGERLTVEAGTARNLHHQSSHRLRYTESRAEGPGWKGRYRCYEGRLGGVHRLLVDEGDQLPEGLGNEVTRCDLEVSLPPLKMTTGAGAWKGSRREP